MTANVLPDIDYSKLEELKKRLPDLSDVDLSPPKMEDVGKRAEAAVDRLLGRRRTPTWPWVAAAAIGLVAIFGLLAAWMTWNRRPAWGEGSRPGGASRTSAPGPAEAGEAGVYDLGTDRLGQAGTGASMARETDAVAGTWDDTTSGRGLTAAESSLTTSHEPDERA